MSAHTRQHYVPQFYLRQWSENNRTIWAYPINGGTPFRSNTGTVGHERGLYSHPVSDGVDPLSTEKIMAGIEGHYSPVWPRICDVAYDLETRKNVARFIAMMACRHPSREQTIRRINSTVLNAVAGMDPTTDVAFSRRDTAPKTTVGEILKGASIEKHAIKSDFLRTLPHLIEAVADIMVQRKWGIVFSKRPAFVTSDKPVVLDRANAKTRAIGFRTPGTQILFPICPTKLLVICDEWPQSFAHYEMENADRFNELLVRYAVRFAFWQEFDDALAKKVAAWKPRLVA